MMSGAMLQLQSRANSSDFSKGGVALTPLNKSGVVLQVVPNSRTFAKAANQIGCADLAPTSVEEC